MTASPPAPYTRFPTALGTCTLHWDNDRVAAVQLRPEAEGGVPLARAPAWVRDVAGAITRHVGGEPQDLSAIPLATETLSPFDREVFEAARAVAPGETLTYGELAKRIGKPGGARAVGQALGRNPFLVVVPCHRVIPSSKPSLGGFSAPGGVNTKRAILQAEKAACVAPVASLKRRARLPKASASLLVATPPPASDAAAYLASRDPVLGRLIDHVGPLGLEIASAQSTIEAIARAIVFQQLTGKAAGTIYQRVKDIFGGAFPLPEALIATPVDTLRAAGLSRAKVASLKDLAQKVIDGVVPAADALHAMDDERIIADLCTVRGVGRWTVEMFLLFRLGRPDILSATDYGIRKGIFLLYGLREMPSPREVTAMGARWAPHRSAASWYLWRANDIDAATLAAFRSTRRSR